MKWLGGLRTIVPIVALVVFAGGPAHADFVGPLPGLSEWDLADLAAQDASSGQEVRQPCPYPGGPFYRQNGDCKYAQALLYTSCAIKDSTGWCIRRRVDTAAWHGGTADKTSYTPSGVCNLGSNSGLSEWQLSRLRVTDTATSAKIWETPAYDYELHSNCDVEHGPYARAVNLVVSASATVTFIYTHYCRDTSSCGQFTQYVQFGIVFSPRPRLDYDAQPHL